MSLAKEVLTELIIPHVDSEIKNLLCVPKLFLNLDNSNVHFKDQDPLVAKFRSWKFKGDFTVDDLAIIGAERYAGESMNVFRVDGNLDIGRKHKGDLPAANINSFLIASELNIDGEVIGHGDFHVGDAKLNGPLEASEFVAEGDIEIGGQAFISNDLIAEDGSISSKESILAKNIISRHDIRVDQGGIRAVDKLDGETIIAPKGEIEASKLAIVKPLNGKPTLNVRKIQAGTPEHPEKIRISDPKSRKLLLDGIDRGIIKLIAGEIIS